MAKEKPIKITTKDIQNLSLNKVHLLRSAYVKFFKNLESHDRKLYDTKAYREEFSYVQEFQNYVKELEKFYQAYASDPKELVCFFGGWPSIAKGDVCEPPWRHKDDPRLEDFDLKYDREKSCASANQFRCHPLLFGSPNGTSIEAVKNLNTQVNLRAPKPEQGFCINLKVAKNNYDTYRIAKRCNEVSQHRVNDIALKIKDDDKTREQFAQFHDKILGSENGFCNEQAGAHFYINSATGKEHPACRDLRKRLGELFPHRIPSQDEVKPEIAFAQPVEEAPKGNIGKAILDKCAVVKDEENRDKFNRGLIQFYSDGLYQCLGDELQEQKNGLSQFDKDLKKISQELDERAYLQELNDINLSQILDGILMSEYVYADISGAKGHNLLKDNQVNKDKFIEMISERFPEFKEGSGSRKDQLNKIVDSAIKKFNQAKGNYPQFDTQYFDQIRMEAGRLKNICEELKEQFDREVIDPTDYFFLQSDEAEKFIQSKRAGFNRKIEKFMVGTGATALMGSETFQEYGLDPTIDYTEKCAEGDISHIFNPDITDQQLVETINESKELILKQLEKLNEKEELINDSYDPRWYASYDFEDEIEDYLKNNRGLLLTTLLNTTDEEEIKKRAFYICSQVDEEYTKDWWKNWGSLAGFAGTSIVAGVTCVFSAGIGCAPAFAAAGLVGGAVGVGTGSINYLDGLERSARSNQNVASGQTSFAQNVRDNTAASMQRNQGVLEAGVGVVSVVGGAAQVTRLGRAASSGAGRATGTRAVVTSGDEMTKVGTSALDDTVGSVSGRTSGTPSNKFKEILSTKNIKIEKLKDAPNEIYVTALGPTAAEVGNLTLRSSQRENAREISTALKDKRKIFQLDSMQSEDGAITSVGKSFIAVVAQVNMLPSTAMGDVRLDTLTQQQARDLIEKFWNGGKKLDWQRGGAWKKRMVARFNTSSEDDKLNFDEIIENQELIQILRQQAINEQKLIERLFAKAGFSD